ncbi:MAG TPA: hypothetical protein VI322_00965 [Candidatus Saccharimonadia bacterium]
MHNRDLRDIKLYGTLTVVVGAVQLLITSVLIMLVLATGASQLAMPLSQAVIMGISLVMVSCGLVGLGGELQRANRLTAITRENLRLTWSALLLLLVAGFLIGLWLLPLLASICAVLILGLMWIRQPVIRVTS